MDCGLPGDYRSDYWPAKMARLVQEKHPMGHIIPAHGCAAIISSSQPEPAILIPTASEKLLRSATDG